MKKIILILMLVFSFCLHADEIPICEIPGYDVYLNKYDLRINYFQDGNDDSFYIYLDQEMLSTAFLFKNETRRIFLNAIEKASDWKDVAIENNVESLSKRIPLGDDLFLESYINVIGTWTVSPLLIDYMFYFDLTEEDKYYLIMYYRTIDEANSGQSATSALVLDIGDSLNYLYNAFSDESIAHYRKEIEDNQKTEDLFQ